MTNDLGLRPLYLLLFAAGIGILVSLAVSMVADTAHPSSSPGHREAMTGATLARQ